RDFVGKRRMINAVEHDETVNPAVAAHRFPSCIAGQAVGTQFARREPEFAAHFAARNEQPMLLGRLPKWGRLRRGRRHGFPGCSCDGPAHQPRPRIRVEWQTWLPPWPETSAISASFTCRSAG